jgi:hypothetical protein
MQAFCSVSGTYQKWDSWNNDDSSRSYGGWQKGGKGSNDKRKLPWEAGSNAAKKARKGKSRP